MATPVVTNKWAGTFDCGGECRRKRLMGEDFSKKALERFRKDSSFVIRCKACVSATEKAERERAAVKKQKQQQQGQNQNEDSDSNESRKCSGKCCKVLSKSEFNRNQWSKGEGKSRCRTCVELAIQEESNNQSKSKEAKIEEARRKVDDAKKTGNAQRILAAESELAALEAEKVTGLKPVKMSTGGRGGRFGRRGGGGRGRGRGTRR